MVLAAPGPLLTPPRSSRRPLTGPTPPKFVLKYLFPHGSQHKSSNKERKNKHTHNRGNASKARSGIPEGPEALSARCATVEGVLSVCLLLQYLYKGEVRKWSTCRNTLIYEQVRNMLFLFNPSASVQPTGRITFVASDIKGSRGNLSKSHTPLGGAHTHTYAVA